MKLVKMSACAVVGLAAATSFAMAASNGATRGASAAAPGQQMRSAGGPVAGAHGASSFSPGHQMQGAKAAGEAPAHGASSFTPGATISKGKN